MANPVFSTQFYAEKGFGFGATYYTVPSGYVGVLRSATAFSFASWDSPPQGITFGIQHGAQSCVLLQKLFPWVEGNQSYDWEGHQVMDTGDGIFVDTYDASLWSVIFSGYLLKLP